MKKLASLFLFTVILICFIPWLVTFCSGGFAPVPNTSLDQPTVEPKVEVYNPQLETVDDIALEEYIKGVVSAEMPASFEPEALKAQAIASRTYALRKITEWKASGKPMEEVTKNIGQKYLSVEELKTRWGNQFDSYYQKISDAVDATTGKIMVYEGEPILAVFHSTSAGMTETAKNVWNSDVPYLVSVDSADDQNAPNFETNIEFSQESVMTKLQQAVPDLLFSSAPLVEQLQIAERSQAGYVTKIQVGNKLLTGRQVREALDLRSTDFTIQANGDRIVFTTKGYGHGAGMSQYGANFMAKNGYSFEEILQHYYQNIEIKKQ